MEVIKPETLTEDDRGWLAVQGVVFFPGTTLIILDNDLVQPDTYSGLVVSQQMENLNVLQFLNLIIDGKRNKWFKNISFRNKIIAVGVIYQ